MGCHYCGVLPEKAVETMDKVCEITCRYYIDGRNVIPEVQFVSWQDLQTSEDIGMLVLRRGLGGEYQWRVVRRDPGPQALCIAYLDMETGNGESTNYETKAEFEEQAALWLRDEA